MLVFEKILAGVGEHMTETRVSLLVLNFETSWSFTQVLVARESPQKTIPLGGGRGPLLSKRG